MDYRLNVKCETIKLQETIENFHGKGLGKECLEITSKAWFIKEKNW